MRRLGYKRWAAQGGDWGAAVTTALGYQAPAELVGIHLNMVMFQPTEQERENVTAKEQEMIASAKRYGDQFSGYFRLQSTRPQSIGFSLADSPAGLAAWIYASVSRMCRTVEAIRKASFTLDEMLDDIMLYWIPKFWREFSKALLGSNAGDDGGWHVFFADAYADWNKHVPGRAGSLVASLG